LAVYVMGADIRYYSWDHHGNTKLPHSIVIHTCYFTCYLWSLV